MRGSFAARKMDGQQMSTPTPKHRRLLLCNTMMIFAPENDATGSAAQGGGYSNNTISGVTLHTHEVEIGFRNSFYQ